MDKEEQKDIEIKIKIKKIIEKDKHIKHLISISKFEYFKTSNLIINKDLIGSLNEGFYSRICLIDDFIAIISVRCAHLKIYPT